MKKWSAFESLINDQAEVDGYLFIFRKSGSEEFSALKSEIKRLIDSDPGVLANPPSNEPLTKQLAALERMPVKMISKRFLNELGVSYDESDLNKIVNLRNDILHYIRTGTGLEEVRRLEAVLSQILMKVLCLKLGWNMENELHANYSTPHAQPLPDYCNCLVKISKWRLTVLGDWKAQMDASHLSVKVIFHGTQAT